MRFHTPRGGDEMEQEAQATAQLVLSDLGRRESLYVTEFIRNYDPNSEVVILFTGLDSGGNLAYRCKAGDGPPPPKAFNLYGHQLERWAWRLQ